MENFFSVGLFVFVLIMSVVVHEVAHAWMADYLGDKTARYQGRLTLNPLPHLDPVGSVLVPIILGLTTNIGFGWAKPVPYNPNNIHHKYGDLLVAAAGPISNILLALATGLFSRIIPLSEVGTTIVGLIVIINISLAFFNLIPVPPLDGSKIVAHFLPYSIREKIMTAGLASLGFVLLAILFIWPLIVPLVIKVSEIILAN
jgi:Zn-dependent protease